MAELASIADLIMGQSPPSSTYNEVGEGLPFFQGKVDFGFRHPTPRIFCNAPLKIAKPNDILMSVRAPVGPTNVADRECCIGRGIAAIRPRTIDGGFLLFNLRYSEKLIAGLGTGSTFHAINKTQLGSIEVNKHNFDLIEQQKIAGVLSLIQQAMEQQARLIELTTELKKTLLHQLFSQGLRGEPQKQTEIGPVPKSWKVITLGELVQVAPQVNMRIEAERKIQYIDVSSISRKFLCIEATSPFILKNAPGRARKKVKTGDVIFATVRPTLLRVAWVSENYDEQVCSTAFCVLRDKNRITSGRYIYYLLQREPFIKKLAAIESGVSYPAVTDRQVKEQLVPVPGEREQVEIARTLGACDAKIRIHHSKHVALTALFRTLLHQLMTAEIRVHDLGITGIEEI